MTEKEALRLALKALEINLLLIEDFGSAEQLNAQHKAITAIYEALAQRTWVGLTDKEVEAMQRLAIDPVDANGWGFLNRERYANLIEAKLKEKNT